MSKTQLIRAKDGTLYVRRFSTFRIIEHIVVMLVVVLLVLTGFPQKFYDTSWAAPLLSLFGGLDGARTWHRAAGIAFSVLGLLHIAVIGAGSAARRIRPTLLPTPQDLRDAVENLRYYMGYREHPPAFPKFDYRQKFEYIGMVLGGLVMIATGLVLLYPVESAAILPGQLIAASQVMHSNEALLALMVLLVWHVYGAHVSPEVFPMDTSIFTGKIAVEELKERHRREYAYLFPEGVAELDDAPADMAAPRAAAEDGAANDEGARGGA